MNGRVGMRRVFLLLLLFAAIANARLDGGTVMLGGAKRRNRWKSISKFGFTTGTGTFALRIKAASSRYKLNVDTELALEVYSHDDWQRTATEKELCRRKSSATQVQVLKVQLAKDLAWGAWANGTIPEGGRPRLWHFVLSDCDHVLASAQRVQIEFRAIQGDGAELSAEMQGLLLANSLAMLFFSLLLVLFFSRLAKHVASVGYVHPAIWILIVAMVLHYVATGFNVLHLWLYSSRGSDMKALLVVAELFFNLSQVALAALLIIIGLGYTLLQTCLGDLILTAPVFFMIAVIFWMALGLGKLKDDSTYRFHETEGVVGWIVVILKALLHLWFVWAVRSTAKDKEAGPRLKSYLSQYCTIGSVYFLAHPASFLLSGSAEDHRQYALVYTAVWVAQACMQTYFACSFLGKGMYYQVSAMSASTLPGASGIGGLMKDE